MKQRLWIISELFPPEETSTGYIMGEIANTMCQKYEVKVISGPSVYDSSKKQNLNGTSMVDESIEVFHADSVVENKGSKLSRIKKFLLMSWRMYRLAQKNIGEGDRVLMVTNPFPLVVLMGHLRRHRNFSLAMLVHDVAPENLYTDIHIPRLIYPLVERIFNMAYASTDLLIAIGRDMSEVLARKVQNGLKGFWWKKKVTAKNRIEVIENWGDIDNIRPAVIPFESEKITIQYAGNIGNAQGVGEMVDVLHKAESNQIVFGIWGTGSAEASIKERVQLYGMTNSVMFHGPFFRSDQQNVLNACDIALVRLVEGMYGLGVPSKTYNILAAGKPILYIGEKGSEIWRVIEENGNGICFEPQDINALVSFLRGLSVSSRESFRTMGGISRKLVEEKYSKELILNKFLKIL